MYIVYVFFLQLKVGIPSIVGVGVLLFACVIYCWMRNRKYVINDQVIQIQRCTNIVNSNVAITKRVKYS